jgi:hypothetical protein
MSKQRPKVSPTVRGNRLSVRLSKEAMSALIAHEERMRRITGTDITRSQIVEGLLLLGTSVWDASERTRLWSPAQLIAEGEYQMAKELAAIESREGTISIDRKDHDK